MKMELPVNTFQARAEIRQAADRPVVQPVVALRDRARGGLGFDWICSTPSIRPTISNRCCSNCSRSAYPTPPWSASLERHVTIKRFLDIARSRS